VLFVCGLEWGWDGGCYIVVVVHWLTSWRGER